MPLAITVKSGDVASVEKNNRLISRGPYSNHELCDCKNVR